MVIKLLIRFLLGLCFVTLVACGGSSGSGNDEKTPDTTSPLITLLGENPLNISAGDTYTDPGATASDNIDGNITANITVGGDTVNTAVAGTYVVTYNVSDAAGNSAAQVTRTVIVSDSTAPVITLSGADPLNILIGVTYIDPGATASDNIDGDITGSIAVGGDTVNTAIVGTYVVTYDVSDVAGNSATQVTRTVIVSAVDTTSPVITLLGANPLNITVGDTYTDPGATATDNIDGNITNSIAVGGDTVNTAIASTYVVTYDVSDVAGNSATQVTRTVIVNAVDTTVPVITLLGANPLNLAVGDTYTDPGATASDNIDGDITGSITVGGDTVNTAIAGTYVVTYNVSDAAGNPAAQVTRTVNVVNTPPVITSFNVNPSPTFTGATTTFDWGVSDANGDTLICLLDVDNDGTNDYTINDCANNISQIHIFSLVGDYTARLTVSDSIAIPVEDTVNFTVLSPLSTDVSVNTPVVAGDRLLYTITVGNTSLIPIDGVSVSLTVPAELSFFKTAQAEPNAVCPGTTCNPAEAVSWSLGTLAAGESRTITVSALVDDTLLNGTIINFPVTFSATNIGDIQINRAVEVFNTPSAELLLSASTDPAVPNEIFTYNLDFGNIGGSTLTTLQLRATLPAGVTVTAISDGGTEVNPGEVVWNVASLGVTSSLHREITVMADAALIAGQILQTSAQLTYDGGLAVDKKAEHVLTVASSATSLAVDISTTNNPVVAGDRAFYTLTVSNTSLQPVDGVSVVSRVPTGLRFFKTKNAEPNPACSGTTCNSAEEAFWSMGTLAAGESRTITVDALVDAGLLSGNLISMPFRVTASGLGDDIERSATVAVFNTPSADFSLGASADSVTSNETLTYNLDVGNVGAATLTTLQLRAKLPAGVTVVAISNGGTEINPGEVVWDVASLGVGASLHREVTVTVDAGLTSGQILQANARLTHDGGLDLDNAAAYAVTVASPALPLNVDISTSTSPVAADGRVFYSMTVSNASLLPVNDVRVLLRVPAGLIISRTKDVDPAAGLDGCGTMLCLATAELTWNLGTLTTGESRTITVNALVEAGLLSGNLISMPVRVTATGLGDVIDRLTTVAVLNTRSADFALSASTDPVTPNETFTYNLDVGNISAGALTALQLRTMLPAGVTVVSISDGGTEANTGEVVWDVSNLGVGASLHREVTVAADAGLASGQILQANASLIHNGGLEVDNTAEHVVTVVPSAISLNVDVSTTSPAIAGERVLYTMTVSNASFLPVNDVSVLIRVPAGLTWQRGQRDKDPNASFNGCGSSTCLTGAETEWSLGTLAAGESRTITINPLVDAGLMSGSLISMPIRISATGLGDTVSLLKTITAYNMPSADLALSASTDPVTTNETFTYNLDISNVSANTLTTLQLRASLPAGVTVTAISNAGTEVSTGEVVWDISSLTAGTSLHREVTVTADSAVAGDILKLHAELSHDGGLELDNSADFAVSVATNPSRLSVLIAAAPDPVVSPVTLNGSLVYTITVTNDFALPVDSVEVMFRLPAELSFSNTDTTPRATGFGQEATFSLGTFAAGASQIITINATVSPGLNSGTLISVPVRTTATGLPDTINLQHTTAIQN